MAERSHLSIGEVLSLLHEEFPDVTISKIRFLESQGLVDPERTPSGYRKFYEQDVDRLRWILRQQREHFLPLKVIRGRLSEQGEPAEPGDDGQDANGSGGSHATSQPGTASEERPGDVTLDEPRRPVSGGGPPLDSAVRAQPGGVDRRASRRTGAQRLPGLEEEPAEVPDDVPEGTAPRTSVAQGSIARAGDDDHDTYSAEELAAATGATPTLVNELKQYGLISVHAVVAGTSYFDNGAFAVTRAAAAFARHGVEARHLRAWRNAADRETALFEQLVTPLLRQRNPQARRQAAETVAELARLGGELRAALVEIALRDLR